MKKIYFRNSAKFDDLKVVAYNGNESIKDEISITGVDSDADFVVDFDDDRYDHIEFTDGNNKTSKVYTGSFNIGVEYKKNGELGRYLTYLFSNDITSTGRVESFELTDETNLYYRSDKSKKICVFVPSTYDNETPHDILYFFDAQNLFSNVNKYTNNGDPYGSWQLDVVISELHRQYGKNIIVVGIDNADEYRSHELFMSPQTFGKLSELATSIPNDNFSKGYLDDLSQFIVNTLHPFVREKYCVKEDSIGIGGSSMGGIAAFYCGLREQGFYKYVLSYSPFNL